MAPKVSIGSLESFEAFDTAAAVLEAFYTAAAVLEAFDTAAAVLEVSIRTAPHCSLQNTISSSEA